MSELHRVSRITDREARLTVVFVHGLGGDSAGTWRSEDGIFWPAWLAEDVDGLAVYSFGYEASISKWFGTSMALADRATNALAQLQAEGLGKTPMVFVAHSLGGLVVKQMLRNAHDYAQVEWKNLSKQIKAVIFLATPHTGSRLADYLSALGKILNATAAIRDLSANADRLRDLNHWYRGNIENLGIETRIFFEQQNTMGVRVVDEASSDIGLKGLIPVPVDANHFSICKPTLRTDLVYKGVRQILKGLGTSEAIKLAGTLEQLVLSQIEGCRLRNLPFRTPHFVMALFQTRSDFTRGALKFVNTSAAERFEQSIRQFVIGQAEVERGVTFSEFALDQHPIMIAATDFARSIGSSEIDERHLFVAVLQSPSNAIAGLRQLYGNEGFAQLQAYARTRHIGAETPWRS